MKVRAKAVVLNKSWNEGL